MKLMTLHYVRSDLAVKRAVRDLVGTYGVPTTPEAADDLAARLWPVLSDQRATLAARELEMIKADFPDFVAANRRFYPVTATSSATRNAAGLNPAAPGIAVEHLDPVSQKQAREVVRAWQHADDPAVIERFIDELAASTSRHVKSASRDLVTDTARLNSAGWARQLTGAESCAFCAMLVSRGAVYSRKTADFQTHNHCDCTATLVRNAGDDYPGKEQARVLAGLYRAAGGDLTTMGKLIQEEVGDFAALAA